MVEHLLCFKAQGLAYQGETRCSGLAVRTDKGKDVSVQLDGEGCTGRLRKRANFALAARAR